MAWLEKRKRKQGATWLVGWWETQPGGRKKVRQAFHTEKEAKAFKASVELQQARGEHLSHQMRTQKVSPFVRGIMDQSFDWRPSTRTLYEGVYRRFVEPELWATEMRDMTPGAMRHWFRELTDQDVPPSILALLKRLLSGCMRQAVREGYIHQNPMEGVQVPKSEAREIVILTPSEVQRIADAMPARYRAMVILAAYCGLRIGETCGLTVENVNLLKKELRINQQVVGVGGKPQVGPLKTKAAKRVVTMPGIAVRELARHMAEFPPRDGFLFYTGGGQLMFHTPFNRVFQGAVDRVGLETYERPRVHDLRHTSAVWAINAGANPKQVQGRLGHASIQVTLNTYTHYFPGDDADVAARLDTLGEEVSDGVADSSVRYLDADGNGDRLPGVGREEVAGEA